MVKLALRCLTRSPVDDGAGNLVVNDKRGSQTLCFASIEGPALSRRGDPILIGIAFVRFPLTAHNAAGRPGLGDADISDKLRLVAKGHGALCQRLGQRGFEAAFKALLPPRGTGRLSIAVDLASSFDEPCGTAHVRYQKALLARAQQLHVTNVTAGWEWRGDLCLAWVLAHDGCHPTS